MSSSYRPHPAVFALPVPGFVMILAGQPSVGYVACCVGFLLGDVLYYLQTSRSARWGLPSAVLGIAVVVSMLVQFPGDIHWN
jgi:hypothetical protein